MFQKTNNLNSSMLKTSALVKIGMMSALGMVLMLLDFPLPIFPSFLKIDLSDVPAMIGAFTMGPAAGVLIEFLKNLLKLIVGSNTGGVGELANFLTGAAYVLPLGTLYRRWKSKNGVIFSMLVSTLTMTLVAGILNYLVFIPAFGWVMGYPIDAFVSMGAKVNASIVDLKTLVIFAIMPFNIVKGIIMSVFGYGLYRALKATWK